MPCKVKSFLIIQNKIPGLLFLLSDLKTKTVSLNVIDGFLDKAEAGIVRLLKLTSAEVVRSWGESEWCCAELRELSSNDVCFKMAWWLDLQFTVFFALSGNINHNHTLLWVIGKQAFCVQHVTSYLVGGWESKSYLQLVFI